METDQAVIDEVEDEVGLEAQVVMAVFPQGLAAEDQEAPVV